MPRRIQLPDGRWVYVPDVNPYVEQILSGSTPRTDPPQWTPNWGIEEEEDEGTLAGSAWEGFKSIPSGVADIFLSGAQAAIGIATPFADLPVEKRLRKKASKRARERDPAYQDAFLPAVGTGLGQVAGLSALSRLPGGWYATMGAGVGMGISEQTRRIADYEQRTGTNVPWYKESAAHLLGALVGLTEVVPIKGLFPVPIAKMMGRMQAGLSPNSFRHASKLEQTFGLRGAMGQGLMEATQEASAQWLQALSSRGLYDPNAMEDVARSMAEDFKVGGAVGVIAKLVQHQILGAKFRRWNADAGLSSSLMDSRWRQDQIVKGVADHITGISDTLPTALRELGIEEGLADDIAFEFGAEWAAIPFGMDHMLSTGRISRLEVQQLITEFNSRNERVKRQLDGLIEHHSKLGNPVGNYERAKVAIDEMVKSRINGLNRTVDELGGSLGEMGGISGTKEYQKAREEAIDADFNDKINVIDIQASRNKARKSGGKISSFVQAIRSLMGGSFGVSGLFKMSEILGVHGGIGSEKISTDVDPEFGLATSDQANFDISTIGKVLFSSTGQHELGTSQQPVDNSDVMDGVLLPGSEVRRTLTELDREVEKIEKLNDTLFSGSAYSFTRELSEIERVAEGKEKFKDEAEWKAHRGVIQETVFKQTQTNNAEISRIEREKNVIYLRLLSSRLAEIQRRFTVGDLDLDDKKRLATRVFGTPDTDRFDVWLDKTITAVKESQKNGEAMSQIAQEEHDRFMGGLAAQTDISQETKDALEAQFLSQNAKRRLEFPRDISASQFIKIADLFIDDPKDAEKKEHSRKRAVDFALMAQAFKGINIWKIDDELYDVGIDGVPVPNDTRAVLNRFLRKLEKSVTNESGQVIPEKDVDRNNISAEDIVELLQSKNIYLRDGKRIGNALAELTGVGVESRPFKKLLFDMTGAPSWEEATYAQRFLMYSRLLQLPSHYKSRSSPEEQRYLEERDKGDYRPLFLPDFYYDPSIDSHVDFMTDRVVEITKYGKRLYPSLEVGYLRSETRDALGKEFNDESFDEALARLIESGVFNPTDSDAPTEIISPETWETRHVEPLVAPAESYEEAERIALGKGIEGVVPETAPLRPPSTERFEVRSNYPYPANRFSNFASLISNERPEGMEWYDTVLRRIVFAKSVEHIYQAQKFEDPQEREYVYGLDTALEAKRYAQRRETKKTTLRGVAGKGLRIKRFTPKEAFDVMLPIVREKFKLPEFRELLKLEPRAIIDMGSGPGSHWRSTMKKIYRLVRTDILKEEEAIRIDAGLSIDAPISKLTMLSGGAIGADSQWDIIGETFGLLPENIKHLHSALHEKLDSKRAKGKEKLPRRNTLVDDSLLAAADKHIIAAAPRLGKGWGAKVSELSDYLRRNWYQIRYADSVFAIGKWQRAPRDGISITVAGNRMITSGAGSRVEGRADNRFIVAGGTGWGTQMAIDSGKPVFFFDQEGQQWYTYHPDDGMWIKIVNPTITVTREGRSPRFAGIGTREINKAGRQAIHDVYMDTVTEYHNDKWENTVLSAEVGATSSPDHKMSMNFNDGATIIKVTGTGKKSKRERVTLSMREGLEGKSTMELIEAGIRTGTSRRDRSPPLKKGQIIEFTNQTTGRSVRVRVTKGWKKLTGIKPEHWSEIEGWDTNAYKELAEAGYWQFEYELIPEEQVIPEVQVSEGVTEYDDLSRELTEEEEQLSFEGMDAVDDRIREQTRKEYERPASKLSSTRVRFNVNFAKWGLQGAKVPISPREQSEVDEDLWIKESNPKRIQELLADEDARWAKQVDDLWASYQEKHPYKPLTRKEFIDIYTPILTSSVGLQELSDQGILDTILGVVATPGRMAPTESILELGTPEGRSLVQSLMKEGALPSSLRDNVQALRRRFIDTMKTRFEVLDRNFEQVIKKMRLPDNIQRQYVDDFDGLFQFLGDVAIRGELIGDDVGAIYDRPGNRIIINLAAIDPNNMVEAQDIIRSAAFHEGLHALFIRDHLSAEELDILYNFVRNAENVVPEEIDEDAYNADLTWFERSVVKFADSDLAEGDIEKEAVVSLLENMIRHPNVFDTPRIAGTKARKIGTSLGEFLEGFVDAAKDANIVDVMRILGRIESGAVGDRGAGYLGDPENTANAMIRSNDLLRYANPQDIERLRAAVVLRDAAPSDEMRASEQAKVDDISDKIIANRGIIQESAPPPPDAVKALENQRKLIQDARDTHSGSIPLIGLDQEFKDSEAYKLALDTFMEMRGKDPRYAYKMPDQYQTSLFDKRPTTSSELQRFVSLAREKEVIGSTPPDATRKSFEAGGELSGTAHVGEDAEATKTELQKTASQFRYNYLDRRYWVVEQTDRLIAAQNRAQLDAETSALVMWRNSDNAVNFLRGLMIRGPLSYLGRSVGAGNFENVPVYDNELQEKYGGDGRVQGLVDIISPIIDSADQEAALIYGIAKRVQWTKGRLDSFRSVSTSASLDPAIKLKWQMFEKSYKDIRKSVEEFTDDQLNEIIRETETNESNKHIIEFWDRYNAYDNHMIKMSYNTGMITREQRDEWLSMPYAPFYRESNDIEKFPIGSQQELAQRGINLVEKSLQESKLPITTNLVDSLISNTQALVRDAMMNVSVSRTVRDAVILGDAKKINISGMAASVNNRVVRVMEDGVPVFYELADPQLAMSSMMLGFNPKKQLQQWFGEHKVGELTQKALTNASQLLRESVTRTPPFAIKNVFRDSWTAMSLTGGGPQLVLEAFSNAFNVDSLRRADELGLSIGIDFLAEPGEYGNKMQKELDKANLDWKNPLDAVAAAWHFSGRIAQQSEVATRLAVYDRILAATGDKALAMHYAVEIMNYGRRGASQTLSTYMSTVPFMNGRIQGMDVTYRGLRSKKGSSDIPGIYGYGLTADEYSDLPLWQKNRQQILGRGAALTFATWMLYMLMRDDEEWQDLREEVKSDNWVLPLSDHAWLKIPIPFEVGVLFKVIPEKLAEAVMEKDVGPVDVASEVKRQLQSSLDVAGWPQLLAPIKSAWANYDAFRKDAIVDHWMEETLSPNEQRNAYTSNVARGIADFANSIPLVRNLDFLTSPMKVEYMVRQYVGTAGGYIITLADRLARTGYLPDIPFDPYMNLAEAERVVGTNKDFDFKSLIGGEGVVNVPILGDLLTDPRTRGGRQQQFYKMIEELDEIVATLGSISERDYEKGFEYKDKHMNILTHQRQLRFIQNQMRDWRARRDHVSKIPLESMSEDEERAYYHRLLKSRQDILTSVNDLMASIRGG